MRGLADAVGDRLGRERVPPARVVDLAPRRRRVGRVRVAGHVHLRRRRIRPSGPSCPSSALSSAIAAAALRVVAVPGDVPPGMDERRRAVARHLARGLADQARVDAGLRVGPLRRVRRDLGRERVEAEAVRRDVLAVVEPLGHEHVHPGQQQGEVGARLDRQVVLRLARRHREARVDDDDRGAGADRLGELLRLGVVHVLAEVRADQHQAARVADVGPFGRADLLAEGQREADVARPAALGERGRGDVRRAERLAACA